MLKQVLLPCVFLVMLSLVMFYGFTVFAAAPSVSASYDQNARVVTVTGTGFVPGQSYMVMLTERAPTAVVGFQTVTADAGGGISSSIPSGPLADGLLDVHVSLVGGGEAVSVEYVLRIGEAVPVPARFNPQTGEGFRFVLAIAFGFAVLGMIALFCVYRKQLRQKQVFRRFVTRKNRLDDLLD